VEKTNMSLLRISVLGFLFAASLSASPASDADEERARAKLDAADIKAKAELQVAEERSKAKLEIAEQKAKAIVKEAEATSKAERERTELMVNAKADVADAKIDQKKSEAGGRSSSSASSRHFHPLGAYASLWGDPYPSNLGVNIAYNVEDFVRINVGVGSNTPGTNFKIDTVGAGVKLFVPTWSLSPSVGFNIANSSGNSSNQKAVFGFDPSGTRAYVNAGFDWQTNVGLYFAAGYAQSLRNGEGGSFYANGGIFL
jgi:hypothetical protein